jgi:steroid 5-alpha reductase family enzyme
MELPAVLTILVLVLAGGRVTAATVAFLVLWELHYVYRTFVFPFRLRGSGRRTPWSVVAMAAVFNVVNGYFNGSHLSAAEYSASWLGSPQFLAGAALFLVGFAVNIHSDSVLRNLRKPGETGYKIPQGGLYRFVSCPNYFGEVLEWTGWAIATSSLAGLSFAVWTVANLVPRAVAHHRWYRERFPDYPKERKAVVPFLI